MNCRAQSHRLSEISLAIAVSFQCSNRAYLIPEWHATLLYKRCSEQEPGSLRKKREQREKRRDLNGRETVVSLGGNANYQIRARDLYYSELWIALLVKINGIDMPRIRGTLEVIVSTVTQCEILDKV